MRYEVTYITKNGTERMLWGRTEEEMKDIVETVERVGYKVVEILKVEY